MMSPVLYPSLDNPHALIDFFGKRIHAIAPNIELELYQSNQDLLWQRIDWEEWCAKQIDTPLDDLRIKLSLPPRLGQEEYGAGLRQAFTIWFWENTVTLHEEIWAGDILFEAPNSFYLSAHHMVRALQRGKGTLCIELASADSLHALLADHLSTQDYHLLKTIEDTQHAENLAPDDANLEAFKDFINGLDLEDL